MDTFQFQQQFLPQNYSYGDMKLDFKTENDFQVEFHASINNLSEGHTWIGEFERLTKTNWKIRSTYPNLRGMQRKDYVCRHADFRNPEKRKKSNKRVKLFGCNAKLTIKIKAVNKYSQCRYPWIKEGRPATVTIFSQHQHAILNDPCNSTTPVLLDDNPSTGVFALDAQQAWKTLSNCMGSLLAQQSGDCSELVAGIQKMQQRLNKVTTYSQLVGFYRSMAPDLPRSHHSQGTIRTQPGTAAREKAASNNTGAKRQLSGRPAACEKRKVKRARNLQGNVLKNMPNAKSHGSGY